MVAPLLCRPSPEMNNRSIEDQAFAQGEAAVQLVMETNSALTARASGALGAALKLAGNARWLREMAQHSGTLEG